MAIQFGTEKTVEIKIAHLSIHRTSSVETKLSITSNMCVCVCV